MPEVTIFPGRPRWSCNRERARVARLAAWRLSPSAWIGLRRRRADEKELGQRPADQAGAQAVGRHFAAQVGGKALFVDLVPQRIAQFRIAGWEAEDDDFQIGAVVGK